MNTLQTTIRLASVADITAVVAIIHTAFAEQAMLVPPSGAVRETEASIGERLITGEFALAELHGEPVGCIYFEPRADHFYFGRLAVLPPYQGQGIATALIAHVEAQARTQGFSRIRCGVRVALTQQRARYERRGYQFVEARAHEGYSVPTWVILEKVI